MNGASGGLGSVEQHLTLRVERPVEGCALRPHAYFFETAQTEAGPVRSTVDRKTYAFVWRWYKGPRRPNCANSRCRQAHSYSPLDWRTDPSRGFTLQCVPCLKAGHPRYTLTFCGADCFREAWAEHHKRHHQGTPPALGAGRSPMMKGLEATPDEDEEEEAWDLVGTNQVYTPAVEDIGCCLRVEVSAVAKPSGATLYGPKIARTDPVLSLPPPIPKRRLVTASGVDHNAGQRLRVVTYNVLAEIYATKQAYPYCDYWALTWEYRRQSLLREIHDANADVICLQEVQADHYDEHWVPYLGEMGFDGWYKQKTREAMGAAGKVDGCATFWRRTRFRLADNPYAVEFNDSAVREARVLDLTDREEHAFLSRLLKDNVAQISVLEVLAPHHQRTPAPAQICVANTHLYSNKDFPDVKLWQTLTLAQELEHYVLGRNLPLVLCGDFNSGPESCVYEFLSSSVVRGNNPEMESFAADVEVLPELHNITHRLQLSSAFAAATGGEPRFTNFTKGFVGTLDYVWFSSAEIVCAAVASIPSKDVLTLGGEAIPNTQFSSDHIMMIADLIIYDYSSAGGGGSGPGAPTQPLLYASPNPGLRLHPQGHGHGHGQGGNIYVPGGNGGGGGNPGTNPGASSWVGLRVRGPGPRM